MTSVNALATLLEAFFNLLGHTQTRTRHCFTSAVHACAG